MDSLEPAQSQEIERAVVKKILWHLVPFLAMLYTFCILDRGNITIANLQMKQQLHFSGSIYGFGNGIFFIGYFLFEVPSNLIMERVGARRWIARIMITWGLISASMMFVHTPFSFYALRFLLGVAEAGFYPGVLLYLTYWVPASARAKVISNFLFLTAIFGLLGGPIGGQLLRLDGWHGLAGWQWLFLLEGLPSAFIGLFVFKLMPDSAEKANWLSPTEKFWIANKLAEESKGAERVPHFSWRVALSEPRILALCLIFFVTATGNNCIGSVIPELIKSRSGMPGHQWSNPLVASVLIIPALVGATAMVLASSHSDRTNKRRLHVVTGYLIGGLGFLICLALPNALGVLLAISVSALGERIAAGSYWAVTTNLMGARAAAGGIAFINSVGNLGGFVGPILMGRLRDISHDDFTPGILVGGVLMIAGALIALKTMEPPAPLPDPKTDK